MKLTNCLIIFLYVFLLTSCATSFKSHLDNSIKQSKLSSIAKIKKFNVIYTDLQTHKIDYDFLSFLSSYEKYTRNTHNEFNNETETIIKSLMKNLGYEEVGYASKDEHNIILFNEIIGWDFGDIVKTMAICTRQSSNPIKNYQCAEFKEMTFFNSHPTRELIANNLMTLLLTEEFPQKMDKEKYRLVKTDGDGKVLESK